MSSKYFTTNIIFTAMACLQPMTEEHSKSCLNEEGLSSFVPVKADENQNSRTEGLCPTVKFVHIKPRYMEGLCITELDGHLTPYMQYSFLEYCADKLNHHFAADKPVATAVPIIIQIIGQMSCMYNPGDSLRLTLFVSIKAHRSQNHWPKSSAWIQKPGQTT